MVGSMVDIELVFWAHQQEDVFFPVEDDATYRALMWYLQDS